MGGAQGRCCWIEEVEVLSGPAPRGSWMGCWRSWDGFIPYSLGWKLPIIGGSVYTIHGASCIKPGIPLLRQQKFTRYAVKYVGG